ncbi:MAG: hypothetical protein ONB13_06160 [candidate division KSB1 bacterium]|nr:hypothetical protein [candidate division KSB1 bacterium]MDZ7402403.1 hypothetical protein [candidate division KSB1 bacterium]
MQKSFSHQSSALLLTIAFTVLVALMPPLSAQTSQADLKVSTELKNFDNMVLQSRQEMRQYCAIVQELIKQADGQKQAKGLEHIRQSLALWEKVQQNFQSQPPAEYQQDEKFGSRLDAIHQGIVDMEKQLADGKFKEAMQICGATCGLFVKLHEENNLVYAADRLFHLRKLAKKMIDEEQKTGLNPVKGMLGELLKLRDNVFLAPCPAPDDEARCKNYQSALKTLSAQLDDLAICMVNGNQAAAENILKNLMAAINLAYGIAL